MLFDFLNFIGSFFEESIFHFFFLCHVPGRFIRMKDKNGYENNHEYFSENLSKAK